MRHFVLASILYSLAVNAAPAPQTETGENLAGTLLGPDGFCSAGNYWNGFKYVPCAPTLTCKNNICDRADAVVSVGVSTTAVVDAPKQTTEVAAGASGSGGDSATADQASSLTDASATSATVGAVTSALASDKTGTAGALETGTGSNADKSVTQSGDSEACVDTPTNPLLALQRPPDKKWEMTGAECKARSSTSTKPRYVAYWNQWATGSQEPSAVQLEGVTHLVFSFAAVEVKSGSEDLDWVPLDSEGTKPSPFSKATVESLKGKYAGLKVIAAFGGWGFDAGFARAADTGDMKPLAQKIVKFKQDNSLDGIDLDWEFPVGGGGSYKSCLAQTEDHKIPERPYEGDAYADLMRHIRALDPEVHLTVAVPARKTDRELAFPKETVEKMDPCLDEWNLMTYDMMNRRDDKTAHHAGSAVIEDVINYYHFDETVDKKKMNIGFPNYAKYFTLDNSTTAEDVEGAKGGLGLPIFPAEKAAGQDAGVSGAWQFNQAQWELGTDAALRAQTSWAGLPSDDKTRDATAGASSWADIDNQLFWTWTTPADIEQSCSDHLGDVGGIMVWSINQDVNGSGGGPHMEALAKCVVGNGGVSASTVAGGNSGVSSSSTSGTGAASTTEAGGNSGASSSSITGTGASSTTEGGGNSGASSTSQSGTEAVQSTTQQTTSVLTSVSASASTTEGAPQQTSA